MWVCSKTILSVSNECEYSVYDRWYLCYVETDKMRIISKLYYTILHFIIFCKLLVFATCLLTINHNIWQAYIIHE